jgi:hypothetical protein
MKTLSISLCNRPKYTKILFEALDNCFDINNYHIIIRCEPVDLEVIEIASKFRPHQTNFIINENKYGCNKNIFACLNDGFEINDYHIHLEDDTIPGKDCLLYFEWARHKYKSDKNIFTVTSYNKTSDQKNNSLFLILKNQWFTPWGWSTWKDRWDTDIKDSLIKSISSPTSWDFFVNEEARGNRYEIFPSIGRTQNIGAELGTYCPGPEWHKDNQFNEFWVNSMNLYTHTFFEN